jgi:CheY-like chemotaxis protein
VALPRTGKTVLCIDDHETALAGWSLYLHGVGYGVLSASNPTEGLQLFSTTWVDAVVLDYAMPEMDGAEVAATMKHIKPGVPVIMFTAHELPPALVKLVDAVMIKGHPPQELLKTLDSLLNISLPL